MYTCAVFVQREGVHKGEVAAFLSCFLAHVFLKLQSVFNTANFYICVYMYLYACVHACDVYT